ncbi:MAG TPA: hypothetical protein VFO27_04760 [Bryobacteraceae bacterium]|nr:hypothetical protein [Bryobacteraceae bacterium]
MIRRAVIRALLGLLNSRWLNQSPCRYGYIGNVEAFDIDSLRSEVRQRPDLTVRTLIQEADRFRACPLRNDGVTVLEADGTSHEADCWDIQELRRALTPEKQKE